MRIRLSAVAALGAAVASLAACTSREATPVEVDLPVEAVESRVATGGITATLRVTPGTVSPGAPLTVRFAVGNPGAAPVRVLLSCTATAMLAMRTEGQTSGDALNGTGCGAAMTERTIAAGGENVLEFQWRAAKSMYPPPELPLAPGRYVVEAQPTVVEVDGRRTTLPPLRAVFTVR